VIVEALIGTSPPLEGEGLGRGGVSEKAARFIDSTPTLRSPLKGEGSK
jgi:hypothetical protein